MHRLLKHVVACFLIGTMTLLAGCGGTGATGVEQGASTNSNEKIELEFWYPFTGTIQEANEELVKRFNESQNDIHVTASTQGNYSEVEQKVRQSMAAGTAPDVFITVINSAVGLGNDGVTQSLSPYMEQDSNYDTDDFYEGVLTSSLFEEAYYGLPYFNSTCLLYYNKDMFDAAGIKPENLETWEGFRDVANKLANDDVVGVSNNEFIWVYESLIQQAGELLYNEDYTKSNFDTPSGYEAAQFMVDMAREGSWHLPTPFGTASGEAAKQLFFSQKAGMFFASTANLSSFLQASEENGWTLGATMLPKHEKRAASVGGSNIVMVSGLDDEKAQAAWTFIKFMTSQEANLYASEKTGYLPIRKSVAESEQRKALEEKQPLYAVAREQLQYATPAPANPGWTEISQIWNQEMEALISDPNKKVEDAMNQVAKRTDEIIND